MEGPAHSGGLTADDSKVKESILALRAAASWDQLRAVLLEQEHILLSDAADAFLALVVERGEQAGMSKGTVAYYRQLLDLLRRCREGSIDSAINEFEMPLVSIEADPQIVLKALLEFLYAIADRKGRLIHDVSAVIPEKGVDSVTDTIEFLRGFVHSLPNNEESRWLEAYSVLERERDTLLTDTADRILDHLWWNGTLPDGAELQEKIGMSWETHLSEVGQFWLLTSAFFDATQVDPNLSNSQLYRFLLRLARQHGIKRAWGAFIYISLKKMWPWLFLFVLVDEWVRETVVGSGKQIDEPRQGSAIYEGYRQGRHSLETLPLLLAPDFLESPLDVQITEIEEQVSSYQENFKDKSFVHPSLRSESSLFEAPFYGNQRTRIFGLLQGRDLLRDTYARGGTSQAIRDAYVNAYGAFALDLPVWIEDVLKQLDTLQEADDSKFERAALLREAFIRAHEDADVAPEIVVELGRRFIEACEDDPLLDPWALQQSQIELYTEFLKVYTRERYPYQWALLQKALGDVYKERADSDSTADHERFIQCYESALQVINRKTSHASWDLTQHNRDWALMQNKLGRAYSQRVSGGQKANLTRAAECLEAGLAVYSIESNLYAHRDMQLDLAFLYSGEWVSEALRRGDGVGVQDAYRRAHEAFAIARQAHLELSWREYYFQNRIKNVVTWPGVRIMYAYDAWCLWQLGDLPAGVAALEDGRAQALAQAQAIAGTVLDGVCDYHLQEFLTVRQNWDEQLAKGTLDDIRRARGTFLDLRDAIRAHCKSDFLPEQATYHDIAQAAPGHALVYIMAMEQGGVAFIVPPTRGNAQSDTPSPIAIALPKLTWRRVRDWLVRLDEKRQHAVGGYQFALQRRGIELLGTWVESADYEQEQERRLTLLLRDLPTAISTPFATLGAAISDVVETWRLEADLLSRQTDAAAQTKTRELRTRLDLTLQQALEKHVLTADLNWFLLEAELEQLQQALSETFVADLRRELDHFGLGDPDQPIDLIPCGQLGMLPIHAAWVRSDPSTGERIPFLETCELTYQASARSLASARKALVGLPKQGPVVAIGNPRPTKEAELHWAEAEAQAIVALAKLSKREGSEVIVNEEATLSKLQATFQALREKPSGAWIQVASHGNADPTDPTNCYMLLSHDERLTLADLQRQRLLSGLRGFNASGCVTAVGDLELAPDELSSFAAGVLQAGAPCAVATLWTVRDIPTFLLMVRFMRELFQKHSPTPARALREAAHWLRTATYEQLGDLAKKGLQGVRSVSQDLTQPDALRGVLDPVQEHPLLEVDALRLAMKDAFPLLAYVGHVQGRTKTPYSNAAYWAAAVIYGV